MIDEGVILTARELDMNFVLERIGGLSLSRLAYLRVFKVCSEEEVPGLTQAIIIVLLFLLMKETLRMRVSLLPQKGMCCAF